MFGLWLLLPVVCSVSEHLCLWFVQSMIILACGVFSQWSSLPVVCSVSDHHYRWRLFGRISLPTALIISGCLHWRGTAHSAKSLSSSDFITVYSVWHVRALMYITNTCTQYGLWCNEGGLLIAIQFHFWPVLPTWIQDLPLANHYNI